MRKFARELRISYVQTVVPATVVTFIHVKTFGDIYLCADCGDSLLTLLLHHSVLVHIEDSLADLGSSGGLVLLASSLTFLLSSTVLGVHSLTGVRVHRGPW